MNGCWVKAGRSVGDGKMNPRGTAYTAEMDVAVVAGASARGSSSASGWVVRRFAATSGPSDAEQYSLAKAESQARASVEATQVRDRILGSMQDGVLLLDAEWRTAFGTRRWSTF